jgi:hypothetical protein
MTSGNPEGFIVTRACGLEDNPCHCEDRRSVAEGSSLRRSGALYDNPEGLIVEWACGLEDNPVAWVLFYNQCFYTNEAW